MYTWALSAPAKFFTKISCNCQGVAFGNPISKSSAQVLLGEEPIVEYRPSFMKGLELDAFFRHHRMALEVQGAQHRLHNTSWYKDVKKLEDIVDRDRKKRTLCQLNGIYLLEVWYDENPEITIPQKIYKFKEC